MKKIIEEQFPGLAILTASIEHNGIDYNRPWHENYVCLTFKNDACFQLLVESTYSNSVTNLADEVKLTFLGNDEREHLIQFLRITLHELEAMKHKNAEANAPF